MQEPAVTAAHACPEDPLTSGTAVQTHYECVEPTMSTVDL